MFSFPEAQELKHSGFGYTMFAFGNFCPGAIKINGHAFKLRC